jgi:hypothetical protein
MKHRVLLRSKHAPENDAAASNTAGEPSDDLADPDRSTRVERNPASQRRGELIVAAGLGGVLVAVASAFLKLLDLSTLSVLLVAFLSTALVLVGVVKRRRSRPELTTKWISAEAAPDPETVAAKVPPVAADLPSLTGELGGVLSELRQKHGLAYRTHTWIEELVPAYGGELNDLTLARDLLAAAALDAGGIRADVAGVADCYSRSDIIATGGVLLTALQKVLAACEGSTELPAPPPSDLSTWPASRC